MIKASRRVLPSLVLASVALAIAGVATKEFAWAMAPEYYPVQLGDVFPNSTHECSVVINNDSKDDLVLLGPSESCNYRAVTSFPVTVSSRSSATLRFEWVSKSNSTGPFEFVLPLITSDRPSRQPVLVVSGRVVERRL